MENTFFNTKGMKVKKIKGAKAFSLLVILVMVSLVSCGVNPTEIPATPMFTSTPTCTPTATATSVSTITPTSVPLSIEYNQKFLSALPGADDSCLPDKTADDLGIYIYDLNQNRELISINADVPFQFASAFKGPVLVYFLSQCKKYWDTTSPEWDVYFTNPALARDIPYYMSPEYKALIAPYFSDVRNWENVEAFFESNRFVNNGLAGVMDKRYFILSKVYSMATRSNNRAAGEVLQFVFDNCQPESGTRLSSSLQCYEPDAISQFNLWFNEFSKITYADEEPRRGLFKWDVVIEKDSNGNSYEADMVTKGQEDQCVTQTAQLNCSKSTGVNVWTARDFFKFYFALYRLGDASVRNAALNMLSIDNEGPARGNLKNLARKMGASSMSKNGHAHFIQGSINTDAGIFHYQNATFVIVVLGYDAQPSLSLLYGDYDPKGAPTIDVSLIRDLLNEYLGIQQ
jgi:hypothetical protein